VVAALESARTPLVVVIACDMPRLVPALVAGLVGEAADGLQRVTLCRGPDGLEPLPSVWRCEAAPDLRRQLAGGVRALRDAVSAAIHRVVEPERWRRWDPAGLSFVNWNAPGDVEP
jgi:molybdopterin-guanine dinucleotide biosynthesis protein A